MGSSKLRNSDKLFEIANGLKALEDKAETSSVYFRNLVDAIGRDLVAALKSLGRVLDQEMSDAEDKTSNP